MACWRRITVVFMDVRALGENDIMIAKKSKCSGHKARSSGYEAIRVSDE